MALKAAAVDKPTRALCLCAVPTTTHALFPECGFTPKPIDARCVRVRGAAAETSAIIEASRRRGPGGYCAMSVGSSSLRRVPNSIFDATTMGPSSGDAVDPVLVVSACALAAVLSSSPASAVELL